MADGDWVESKDQDPNGDVRLIQLADVGDGEYINKSNRFLTSEKAAQLRCTFLKPGDILVSRMADPIGRACIFPGDPKPCVAVVDICVIRPDAAIADAGWLKYAINSRRFRSLVEARAVGATRPRISGKNLRAIPLRIPPLPEQRRIVDLLSRAEGIVRLRREAEKKAAELIPALFLDMFGDPAANPKGWQMKPLQSVAEVGSGNGFPNTYQGKTEGEFPFYKVSDMNTKGNEVEMRGANNYISAEDLNALRAKAFPIGTVIFPKIGAAIATNKKRMLTRPSCFDNNVMGITAGRDLLPTYVHALMASKNLSDFASDSNPPSIRKTTVEAWEIPVPKVSLQSEFANRVEAIRSIQNQQSTATAKAQATFDALLAQAFSY